MACRHYEGKNRVYSKLHIAETQHEDAANAVIAAFRNDGQRSFLVTGKRVRLRHAEMPTDLFDRIARTHSEFNAFRLASYSERMRSRGVLGVICGVTIYANDDLHEKVAFQYTDVLNVDDGGLIDPMYINHPKVSGTNYVDR